MSITLSITGRDNTLQPSQSGQELARNGIYVSEEIPAPQLRSLALGNGIIDALPRNISNYPLWTL
jgi:hypothetical protein